ncbi:hypothetical protein GCM10010435_35160 [Winogradskya consettensis]|uniref:Uncharacterized protein n=1 Tax=Winogradskya consettensis TaxID=113560 RepID=A0A919VQ29_9ACTN|nr:hypothetical protein [Actinoplanes consettensis]GIM74469.1 hypothetical protein Aco04nite_40480 [Actinoplanes consettensis]
MKLFRRRPKLPADRTPALEPDERVLCWAPAPDDAVLVATNRGLWLPGGTRLGWHEIHKAAWSGRELLVTPAEIAQQRNGYAVLVDAPVIGFLLLEPGELPDQVRARVTRSVAYTSHHPLPPEGGVRVVGRRVSGVDGLTWSVRYDARTAVDADPIVEVTDELVASAQEATTVIP